MLSRPYFQYPQRANDCFNDRSSTVWSTTRGLLNNGGLGFVQRYDYNAFGDFYETPTSMSTKFAYTGQQYDDATGLYFLRARYYDPAIGRFLSQDPYPVNTGNPVELNRYVYTANNPVNYSDPSGLESMVFRGFHAKAMMVAVVGLGLLATKFLLPAIQWVIEALQFVLEPVANFASQAAKEAEEAIEDVGEAIEDAADNVAHKFVRFAFKFKENLPRNLPSLLLILIAGIGLWLATNSESARALPDWYEGDPDKSSHQIIFRTMTLDGGKPKIQQTARGLGVRYDKDNPDGSDIEVDATGHVQPSRPIPTGMSVAPDTPLYLADYRLPKTKWGKYGGTGSDQDEVWEYDLTTTPLNSKLRYVSDSISHGVIEPARRMTLVEYRTALAATQDFWKITKPR